MCLLLSLGTQSPLTEIPWDDSAPGFYLEMLNDFRIQSELGTPFVYYAGSREGCGCGFYYPYEYSYREFETEEDRREKEHYVEDFNKLKGLLKSIKDDRVSLMVMFGNFEQKWTFERRELALSEFGMEHLRETCDSEKPIIYIIRKDDPER